MSSDHFQKSFALTVAESKRLIARGVAACPLVKRALESGIVAVAKGTTNGYIVEELTGEPIHKPHYCTGTTRPRKAKREIEVANKLPDLVLREGKRWEGGAATDAVAEMKAGDVFIKGANALNYERRQAAVLIGHPTGGTVGAAIGAVLARRATFLTPVGLEKNIPGDLHELHRQLAAAGANGSGPALWPVDSEIFTEIEALAVLCGVETKPIGAGGICGAEGAVWLAVWGSQEQIEKVEGIVDGVVGEPAFGNDE